MLRSSLMTITLTLAACGGAERLSIPGQVNAWTRGDGYTMTVVAELGVNHAELATTAIASDGSFTLSTTNLQAALASAQPFAADIQPHDPELTCWSLPTVSPETLRVVPIDFVIKDLAGINHNTSSNSGPPLRVVVADQDGRVQGSTDCRRSDSSFLFETDLNLVAGFNVIDDQDLTSPSDPNHRHERVGDGTLPSPLILRAFF